MPKPLPRILAVLACLHLMPAAGLAQQVWITGFSNMAPGEKPNGYRFDYNSLPLPGVIQVDMAYTRVFATAGFDVYMNGVPQQFSCQFSDTSGGGTANCQSFVPYACGKMRVQVRRAEVLPGGIFLSNAVDIFAYDNQRCLPQCDSCQLTTIGQAAGRPVNVATGKFWYRTADAALSGPFGLTFSRWYDNQTSYNGDLGFGWRHSYGAYLDLSQAGFDRFLIVFHDEEDRVTYFTRVLAGGTTHDDISGAELALNSGGTAYTLTTWNGFKYAFDSAGRLTALTDRIGNTQTVNRDAGQGYRITSVVDVLGRSLSFGYDGSNRITSVTSAPPGVSLGFGYTGTTCPAGNLCSATMPDGKTRTYEYTDADIHNLTRVVDPNGNAEEINAYSGDRLASQRTQPVEGVDQNVLTFAYPSSTTTAVTDGLNRTTTYTYDPKLLTVTNVAGPGCGCGGGQSRSFAWDPFLRKTSETDGLGSTHTINWIYGRDVVALYPSGFSDIVAAYPSATRRTEPLSAGVSRVTDWTYYPLTDPRRDLVETETVPSADTPGQNKVTTFACNTQGLLTGRQEQGRIGGVLTTYMTSFSYDLEGRGRLVTIDGPRTDVTDVTTNTHYSDSDPDLARRGQLETVTDAAGNVTTYADSAPPFNTYTLYGQPRRVRDPNGVVREMTYDGRGRLTGSTLRGVAADPADLTTFCAFDDAGRLTRVTLPRANGISYEYDGSNRLTGTIRLGADGNQYERLKATPNVMSEKVQEEAQSCDSPAPVCAVWTTRRSDGFQYDGWGRLWRIDHPDASTVFYTYDAAGNLETVRDERHTVPNTTYGYDYANRLTSTTQTLQGAPGNQIQTIYGYDVQDNLTSVTDPNDNPITFLFDDFLRMRRQTSPVSGVTDYTHDPAGNLSTLTDANSATTTRTYDALNRVRTAVATRAGYPSESVTFTYDGPATSFGRGRLSVMEDPSGAAHYLYERRGLLTAEGRSPLGTDLIFKDGFQPGANHPYAVSYAYDANGNRRQIAYPSGNVVDFTFDFADRPYSAFVASGPTFVTSAAYRPFGPLEEMKYGNGTTKTMTYDSRYRPTGNKLVKDAPLTTLADHTLVPDPVGNITSITDNQNAGFSRTLFGYDDLNRLTTANSGASLWGNGSHTYDRMGNITSLTLGASRTASFTYVGTTSKLFDVTESGIGTRAVSYDAAGNETAVGAATYGYSSRNYLASGEGFGYTYDGRGVRTILTSGGSRRYGLYSPELNLLSESALTTVPNAAVLHEYVWFGGMPVAQVDFGPTTTLWNVTDHLGTPFLQTDSAAGVAWRAEYEPYGRVFGLRTPNRYQPLRLPGQEAQETNVISTDGNGAGESFYNVFRWYKYRWGRYGQSDPLATRPYPYYHRARFYDPELGRFISQDSFLGQVDDPPSLHRYFYGNDNPLRYVDPTGHFVKELLEDAKKWSADMAAVYQRAQERVVARQGVDLGVTSIQGFGIAAEVIRETQQRASNAQAGLPLSGLAAAGNTLMSEMVARPLEMISDSGVGAANLALPGGFAMWQGGEPSQAEMAYALARQQQVAGLKAALDPNLPISDRAAQGLFAVAATPVVVVEGITWGAGGRASDTLGQKAYQAATAPTLTDKVLAGLEAGEQGLTAFGAYGALAAPFTPRPKVWFGDAAPEAAPSSGPTVGKWTGKEIGGRTAYQRNDIFDLAKRSSWQDPATGQWKRGTNVERMGDGLAPIGSDGKSVNLHHVLQAESGPVAEVPASLHKAVPHKLRGPGESFRNDPALKQQFEDFRSEYWKQRSKDFTAGK